MTGGDSVAYIRWARDSLRKYPDDGYLLAKAWTTAVEAVHSGVMDTRDGRDAVNELLHAWKEAVMS